MSISPLYIPLFTIEEVILDKDSGLPLSGGVVKFFRDLQRLTPKPVYQITGSPPDYTFASVGNELTLGIAGDFVDTDGNPFVPYAYPYDADGNVDLYYVTVQSSGAVDQFTREAVPYIPDNSIPPADRTNNENMIANPQFVEVFFPPTGSTILHVTGSNTVTKIAPDWDLITSGTGTVTVERLEPTSASTPTNPPYTLRISADSALGATIQLRQRLNNTPSIFRGDFISANFTAAVISGGGTALSLDYVPSTGTPTSVIPSTNIPTDGAYHTIAGNAPLPQQTNTAATSGFVDIIITIPTSRNIAITSVQIVGVADSVDIPFDQQTTARQKDHLFHYYEDSLFNPKETILAGWNFALNPWQFTDATPSNLANNAYTADQTIVVQQAYVAAATANNVSVGAGTDSENKPFKVKAVTSTNKFAIIQYIAPSVMRPYWNGFLSSLVRVGISSPTYNTTMKFKMRLLYRTSLPPTVSQTEPIASWSNVDGSDPVFAAGWTELKALTDPEFSAAPNTYTTFAFDQFNLPDADIGGSSMLAIVLYTTNNMIETATADQVLFDFVSLVPNAFAYQSAETYDQALRKCQFYYEKSYNPEILPGTVTNIGRQCSIQNVFVDGGNLRVKSSFFEVKFKAVKNKTPVMAFYAPSSGSAGTVDVNLWNGGSVISSPSPNFAANWAAAETAGFESACFFPASFTDLAAPAAAATAPQSAILYHYTADSRLGV